MVEIVVCVSISFFHTFIRSFSFLLHFLPYFLEKSSFIKITVTSYLFLIPEYDKKQKHETTPVQAHRGFMLLPLAS